tara:strand:+ start:824 stop:1141 length:318 start_codon:yes stop_codon:yes gene_type:complete
MAIKIKRGVKINGLKPEMVMGLVVTEGYFNDNGLSDVTVTSAVDGTHGIGSLHYVGYAADVRIWEIVNDYLPQFTEGLSEALGEEFDVVLESDHIHIEFQPKTKI